MACSRDAWKTKICVILCSPGVCVSAGKTSKIWHQNTWTQKKSEQHSHSHTHKQRAMLFETLTEGCGAVAIDVAMLFDVRCAFTYSIATRLQFPSFSCFLAFAPFLLPLHLEICERDSSKLLHTARESVCTRSQAKTRVIFWCLKSKNNKPPLIKIV